VAAGIATLKEIERDRGLYARLEALGTRLVDGLGTVFDSFGVPYRAAVAGSMFGIFFSPEPVVDLNSAMGSDTKLYAIYFHGMLEKGVYLAPSQFEAAFLSTAHTEADVDRTIAAAADALKALGTPV